MTIYVVYLSDLTLIRAEPVIVSLISNKYYLTTTSKNVCILLLLLLTLIDTASTLAHEYAEDVDYSRHLYRVRIKEVKWLSVA